MDYSLKMKKFIVGILTVLMLVSYMPVLTFAEPAGTGKEVAESDWNFDKATGKLKGFKGGKNYDNPTDLVIPETIDGVEVKSLGNKAFLWGTYSQNIKNPLKSVKLPSTLENTGTWAFQGNDLKEVAIPKSVKTLGERTFFGNQKLENVTFEEGIQLDEIGTDAFYQCVKLSKITLPDSIKKIGDSAFKNTSIKKIDLPQNLTHIADQAFALSAVSEITLPSTIESLGKPNKGNTTGIFFRNFENPTHNSYGTPSGQLIFTRVFDTSGKATAENTRGVVNPQPVTIKCQTESGEELKKAETYTGAEYNTITKKGYQWALAAGDGHYYTDYKNNYDAADLYKFADKMIGENYFSEGKEYTLKAPNIPGYAAVNGEIKKTVTKDDHEVTFTYKEKPKVKLTTEGEGLTVEPNEKEIPEGSEITATIHEPSHKKIKKVTLNDEDITKKFHFDGVDHTYKFNIEKDTVIKVSYKQATNDVELELDKEEITLGDKVKSDVFYRGEKLTNTENTVDYTFENGVKADVDHLRGTVKPLEAGKIKVTVSLKKHPEIKAKKVIKVAPVDVTLRLEDVDRTVLTKTPVSVDKLYLEKDKTYYKDITVEKPAPFIALEKALRKSLKVNTAKKDEFDCSDNGNWMKVLGKDMWKHINSNGSHMYYINNKMANLGVGEQPLNDGDEICIFYEKNWMEPSYLGEFSKENYEIMEGETISLKVLGRKYDMGAGGIITRDPVPIKDAALMINNDPASVTDILSGDDGVINQKFDKPGTYFVSAVGTGDIKITRPYAKVVVKPLQVPPSAPKLIKTVGKYRSKALEVHYKKIESAEKYDIAYKEAKNKTWKHKYTTSNSKYTIKGLKEGRLYDVKVAAMSTVYGKLTAGKYSGTAHRHFGLVKTPVYTAKKSAIGVSVKNLKGVSGYEVLLSKDKNLKNREIIELKGASKTKITIKKLKKNTFYFLAVRSYKTYRGNKYTGIRTGIKKVKTK